MNAKTRRQRHLQQLDVVWVVGVQLLLGAEVGQLHAVEVVESLLELRAAALRLL